MSVREKKRRERDVVFIQGQVPSFRKYDKRAGICQSQTMSLRKENYGVGVQANTACSVLGSGIASLDT
jgi:hypothetical protein